MSEPCDKCSMQWQPMPKEESLKELVLELAEEVVEHLVCSGGKCTSPSCARTAELLERAWELE